jgi:dolichyl-phosphate beta-glucosyltransferase
MFSYIVPFHRDFFRLETTLPALLAAQSKYPIKEILLCHNGPPLSKDQLEQIKSWAPSPVRLLHTDLQGLGPAYRMGIYEAISDYVILTASDLPFGFTDLEAFMKMDFKPEFALGSKAHPLSRCGHRNGIRRLATAGFRILRKALLGRKSPDDSQGTHILKKELALKLAPLCAFENYLFQLELTAVQIAEGGHCIELPVTLSPEIYPTNIHIWKDSWNMFLGICKMAWRFRRKNWRSNF